jgi:hypothetical protein
MDVALLPAASAEYEVRDDTKIAIVARMAKRLRFTGDLLVLGMYPV